jgi:long-subunit acyl-CoA synthetase (AMP-forming)
MEGYGLTETSRYPLMICEMGFRVGTVGKLLNVHVKIAAREIL